MSVPVGLDPSRAAARDPLEAAERVLVSWTAGADTGAAGPDLGPAALAALVAGRIPDEVDLAVVRAWSAASARGRDGGLALHGGLSGVLAGLRLLAGARPRAAPAAERMAVALAGRAARWPWRTDGVGFHDYDLVSGASGALLAHLAGDTPPVDPARLGPLVAHLAGLAGDPELTGFRVGAHAGHPLLGWAQGGVVTGLAHGVAGPLAALSSALEVPALPGAEDAVRGVRHLCGWLVREARADALGVVCWPRRGPGGDTGPAGVSRRQGWCYGTPGVSWALWAGGRALERAGLAGGGEVRAVAADAMASLCAAYDEEVHLGDDREGDRLGVCHGAAGVLLVADAFARHAGLGPAAALRERLARHLRERLGRVELLAGTDASLLSGATGALAALLTAAGGDRGWLRCLALS